MPSSIRHIIKLLVVVAATATVMTVVCGFYLTGQGPFAEPQDLNDSVQFARITLYGTAGLACMLLVVIHAINAHKRRSKAAL